MLKISRLLRPFSRQFASYFFCSTSELTKNPPIYEAKHSFGQAGTLNTEIKNINLDIHLKTIWEDYAALKLYSNHANLGDFLNFTENERNCYLEDSPLPATFEQKENSLLIAEIPEYYSLNLTNRGSVGFVKAEVSSKLCGNVKLNLLNEQSKFFASKIKSEFFEAKIKKGNFDISTFLESAEFSLLSEALNVNIKRLGISHFANLELGNGILDIGSIYVGTFTPRGRKPEERPKVIAISNEMKGIEEISQDLTQDIKEHNHINVTGKKLKLNVGNWQGPTVIDVEEADLNFKNYEGEKFVVKADSGEITLNLSRLGSEGLIYMNSGNLKLFIEEELKINIFSYRKKELVGADLNFGGPNLVLYLGDNVNLTFERTKKKSFFERFSKK